jgi:hypothetical protein
MTPFFRLYALFADFAEYGVIKADPFHHPLLLTVLCKFHSSKDLNISYIKHSLEAISCCTTCSVLITVLFFIINSLLMFTLTNYMWF